jgi:AraC-like DNA-binding protein
MPPEFSQVLPVPDWLFREGLYLTHLGWERIAPQEPYPRPRAAVYYFDWAEGRVLPEYCLAWCLEGEGVLETTRGKQEIHPGEAFLFHPGEWHRHRPLQNTGWRICWIDCSGHLPHQWERQKAFRIEGNKPVIDEKELFSAQFQRLLRSAYDHPAGNSAELSWQAIGLFAHFVTDVRVQEPSPSSASSNWTWRARDFIMNHTHTSINVADVAAHLGCNRRTLEIHFKNDTGRTVLEEIQHCRLDRARALLAETNLPLKQVVHRSGFRSREQMRLAFQKLLGSTPSALRGEPQTS